MLTLSSPKFNHDEIYSPNYLGNFSFGFRSFKSIPTIGDGTDQMAVGIQNLFISYALTNKLSLTAGYSGVALYPQIGLSDSFSLGLRTEYFSTKNVKDESGTVLIESGSVFSITIAGNYTLGGFTFIPEVRLDSSENLSFLDKNGEATSKASQFTLAAVYAF